MNLHKEKVKSVYIVEDYLLIRKSLIQILSKLDEFKLLGDFDTAEQCLEAFEKQPSDIVIMDLGLPGMNGLTATHIIKEKYPETNIVVLTSHETEDEVLAALASGASAYALKDVGLEEIRTILREVSKGAAWLHPSIAKIALAATPKPNSTDFNNLYTKEKSDIKLTDREQEVLKLVVEGQTNTEIAETMNISTHTAKAHVGSILSKLSVADRVQAAVKAVRTKIVD